MRPVRLALATLLLLPATAAAQDPTTPPPPPAPPTPTVPAPPPAPTPTPTPPPAPEPAKGSLTLSTPRETLTGHRIRVEGKLSPAVRGERVTVRFTRGSKTLRKVKVRAGADGGFTVGYTPKSGGRVTVRAVHEASAAVTKATAKARHVEAIATSARPGQRTASVRWLKRALRAKRYAISGSGTFDASTGRAVMAFRKLTGMARTETADRAVFEALYRGKGAFPVRYKGHGRHIEGDLTHQVLALINPGGKVYRIYQTASGAPATPTILGNFRVYLKTPGTNAKGMVHSSYFIRGYAIHGYASVPPYPASHGCFRVPIPDARFIYDWIRMGTRVDSYYR